MLLSFFDRYWGWGYGDVGPSTVIGVVTIKRDWVGLFWFIDAEAVVDEPGAGRRSAWRLLDSMHFKY